MVVIKIWGGLGNQMFQYAFSLNYILQKKQVKYDLSYFKSNQCHNGFELERVFPNIILNKANKRDLLYFIESFVDNYKEKQYRLRKNRHYFNETEKHEFSFIEELMPVDDICLKGYWQNTNYFKEHEAETRAAFQFRAIDFNEEPNYSIFKRIKNLNSVGVHIRRGDFLQSTVHRIISLNYYRAAINYLRIHTSSPRFFIFSDDREYIQRHFLDDNKNDFEIVTNNSGYTSYIDMQLMSQCKHNIIANSTFSWWAAWLNSNRTKIVIAPQDWFNANLTLSGLLPKSWIIVESS